MRMPWLAPARASDLGNGRPPDATPRRAAPLDGVLRGTEPPRSRGCAIVTWGR